MSEGLHRDLSEVVRRLMDRATDDQPGTGVALARALDSHPPVVSNKIRGRRRWSLEDFLLWHRHMTSRQGPLRR